MRSGRISISASLLVFLAASAMAAFPDCMNPTQQVDRVKFSGVVPNEIGFYDSCVSKPHMRYMLVVYVNAEKFKPEIFWGQCVGVNCTEAEVAEYFQKNVPISKIYRVEAKDPNVKENQVEFGLGAQVFTGIMALLTLFTIFATVVHQRKTITERMKKLLTTRSTIKNIQDLQVPGMASVITMNPAATVLNKEPTLLGDHAKDEAHKKEEKPFLALFDIVTNIKALVYPRIINPSVQVFDLLRVKAMIWVVLGHENAYRLTVSENFLDVGFLDHTSNSWYFTYNQTAFYAVDIFLFMGGYVAIVSLNKFISNFAPFTWYKIPVLYIFCVFKRYIRIMPAYACLLCFWRFLAPYMIGGPMSQGYVPFWPCTNQTFWESFILGYHIDITNRTMCTGWAWYLALDFRLFLTIPAILIVSALFGKSRSKQVGTTICVLLAIGSVVYTYISCIKNEVYYLNPWDQKQTLNTYYYVSTPQRGVIYYIGCLFAYMTMKGDKKKPKEAAHVEGEAAAAQEKPKHEIEEDLLREEKRKEKKRKAIMKMQMVYLALGTAVTVAVTCVLHYIFQWGRDVNAISLFWNATFIAWGKIFFILGFMTMLLIIGFRFRGFGKYIAENRLLQLIANLSFTMYLFHFTSIIIRTYSLKSIPTYTGIDLFSSGLADITFTLAAALFVALVVEIPAMHLWRVYLEGPILNLVKKV